MKNRIFLTCLILFALISIASNANGADKQTTAESLGQAVVSNPDSVLQVLDKMATSKSKALQTYQINLLRSQAYNAKHMYPLVERYAERTLASDSINNHPKDKLTALLLLADARAFFGNYQGSIESAQEAMKIARSTDNKPAEYGILSRMARTAFAVGNRKQGYEYLDRIIAEGESSTDAHILANVSATYGTKIIELYTDNRFSEGLANSYKRLALIKKMDELGGCPEGFTDQQRAYTYARLAACAEKCGKTDDARKAYDSFMQTAYAQHPMGRAFIMDYLLESHQWKKVLEFTAPLYPILAQGDTINDDYRSLLISDGMAQAGLGDYRKGYELTQRAAAIQDSLYFREKSSRAQELATIFDLNEKELELADTQAQSQRSNILLLTAIGAGLLVLVILVLMVHAYRQSVKREKLAVRQIDELLAPHHMTTSSSDAEKEDFRLFNEMQRKIVDERLFKSPDFNRDGIVEATGLTRAKVTQLIKQFTSDGINDYINRLRVEYSVQVIKDHPEWTIDAIAESCGYIRRATYYNHFKARFGITPAQYRKERSKTADQPAPEA